jgi:NAD(P)-dependent dehydrogenase (short-subunit alcohol dehydrogenase family)
MQLNLKEKSVIVTGAASNIGRGIALAFAEEGAAVAIADLDEARAQVVADEALARGAPKALAVKVGVHRFARHPGLLGAMQLAPPPLGIELDDPRLDSDAT